MEVKASFFILDIFEKVMIDDNPQCFFWIADINGKFSEEGDRWSLVNCRSSIAPRAM